MDLLLNLSFLFSHFFKIVMHLFHIYVSFFVFLISILGELSSSLLRVFLVAWGFRMAVPFLIPIDGVVHVDEVGVSFTFSHADFAVGRYL